MRKLALSDEILLSVEKPARYIGGEINMWVKDPKAVDIRFCMCFPDVYEIGMSHLGIQILYDILNRREDTYCERVYSPWVDLDRLMREKDIPLLHWKARIRLRNLIFLVSLFNMKCAIPIYSRFWSCLRFQYMQRTGQRMTLS